MRLQEHSELEAPKAREKATAPQYSRHLIGHWAVHTDISLFGKVRLLQCTAKNKHHHQLQLPLLRRVLEQSISIS
jgi:hypothetical protein